MTLGALIIKAGLGFTGEELNSKKRSDQVFGWIMQSAGLRQLKTRGRTKEGAFF